MQGYEEGGLRVGHVIITHAVSGNIERIFSCIFKCKRILWGGGERERKRRRGRKKIRR
jgi:hypothetical protein